MAHSIGQLTKKYDFFQEISAIAVFIAFTLVFMFAHKFEKTVIETEKVAIGVIIEKVPVVPPVKMEKPASLCMPLPFDGDDEGELNKLEDGKVLALGGMDFKAEEKAPYIGFQGVTSTKEIVDFWVIEEKPKLVNGPGEIYKNLKYPKMAKRSGVEGLVTLKFICSKRGIPQDVVVFQEKPKNMGFGEAAVQALLKVRFKPGMQRDKAVAVRMTQRIKFRLK